MGVKFPEKKRYVTLDLAPYDRKTEDYGFVNIMVRRVAGVMMEINEEWRS